MSAVLHAPDGIEAGTDPGGPTSGDVRDAALRAARLNLSVVAVRVDGTKQPVGQWREFQKTARSYEQVQRMFLTPQQGLGLVCGAVSGNLEMFEFDDAAVYREFKQRAEQVGLSDLIERIEAGYLEQT
ncbi:MAG: bifunctional DNA primase/polymerase, partial [Chloroflexota bacterium]